MVDNRRSRWIAWDANFYDSSVGVMLRERFGTVGLVLFSGFLCACKRSPIQGQIEYGSTPDALAQMGLPGLELVNERGEPFDLQSFWRSLAAHKQCSTRARGRLVQVKSSNWAKWQEGYGNQKEAERKSRSRRTNTPDDGPPTDRQSTAEKPPDSDLDLDTDKDSDHDPNNPAPQAAVSAVFDAWLSSTGRTERTILDAKRKRLIGRALAVYPVEDVVDAVRGWRHSPHNRGENDKHTVYNDLELVLRDSSHIERFRDLERAAPSTLAVVVARPSAGQAAIDRVFSSIEGGRR